MTKRVKLFLGCALLSVGTLVTASPFSITYNGTASAPFLSQSSLPLQGINPGPYSVQLVFDNGGTTAASQTWSGSHLTCVIWAFNGGTVRFAQNLTTNPPTSALGSVNTDGSGALTSVFSEVTAKGLTSSGYQVSGITLTDPVAWFANSKADVFYAPRALNGGQNAPENAVGDSAGKVGINMIPANWSNPTPFNQACAALPAAPTLEPPFSSQLSVMTLGSVPGLPEPYGGMTFKARDAITNPDTNKLLIIGYGDDSPIGNTATVYEIEVIRNSSGRITGFHGNAVPKTETSMGDAGLTYGPVIGADGRALPGSVLFYSKYPKELGYIKSANGTLSATAEPPFSTDVATSIGGLAFVPQGLRGAGRLKSTGYYPADWHDMRVKPDAGGAWALDGPLVTKWPDLNTNDLPPEKRCEGPTGIQYVRPQGTSFQRETVLVSCLVSDRLMAYETDTNGDPILTTARAVINGGIWDPLTNMFGGSTVDPITGDILWAFSRNGVSGIMLISGFSPPTAPSQPTNVSVTAGNGSANVSYDVLVTDGGSLITGYSARCTPTSGGTPVTVTGNASSITVAGLTNGTPYNCSVNATNFVGDGTASAPMVVTPATVPGAPTNLVATAGNGQVSVAFTAPASNGGGAISSYTVISSPGGLTGTGTTSPIVVSGLTNGTAYTFTVTASNSAGSGPISAPSNPVTPMPLAVAGACGSASGQSFATVPATNLCSAGAASAVLSANGQYTWACSGVGAGANAQCSATWASTGSGAGSASVAVPATGNNNWTLSGSGVSFVPARGAQNSPATAPPANYSFPYGLASFSLVTGTPGSDATVTIQYSDAIPAGAIYMKYGRTAGSPNADVWYPLPADRVSFSNDRKSITLRLTDGGIGDHDRAANSVIVDPGGPAVVSSVAESIPTLSEWAMMFMASLMAMFGYTRLRKVSL